MTKLKMTRTEWRRLESEENLLEAIRRACLGYMITRQRIYNLAITIINDIVDPTSDIKTLEIEQ